MNQIIGIVCIDHFPDFLNEILYFLLIDRHLESLEIVYKQEFKIKKRFRVFSSARNRIENLQKKTQKTE